MKSFIQSIYGLDNVEWIKLDKMFLLKVDKDKYYLYEVDDISTVSFQYQLSLKYPFSFRFCFNKYNSIFTEYDNKLYVLLKESLKKFCYSDSLFFLSFPKFKNFDWRSKWIKKSDFLYNFYNSIKGKYSIIDESFDYYYGLLEYSIFLLKEYNNFSSFSFIQHTSFSFFNYYNPLFFMIDFKERDFAEYIKELFFSNNYKKIDFYLLFKNNQNINFDYNLVFARLFYPNYYFDLVNDICEENKCLSDLEFIVARNQEYEKFLKFIYNILSEFFLIKKISFFEN